MKTTCSMTGIICVAGMALMSASCAGVKCSMKAERIDQPISFTPCVYGATGNVVRVAEEEVVTHFKIKKRFWAMLWRNVALTQNEWDISDDLSREISAAHGDAVVNLTVLSQGDWWWYFSSLLPILPDSHVILVEGDVVRLNPEAKAE